MNLTTDDKMCRRVVEKEEKERRREKLKMLTKRLTRRKGKPTKRVTALPLRLSL